MLTNKQKEEILVKVLKRLIKHRESLGLKVDVTDENALYQKIHENVIYFTMDETEEMMGFAGQVKMIGEIKKSAEQQERARLLKKLKEHKGDVRSFLLTMGEFKEGKS